MGRAQGRQEGQGRAWRRAQGANAKGEGRKRAQNGPEEGASRPSEHHVTSVCLIIAAVLVFAGPRDKSPGTDNPGTQWPRKKTKEAQERRRKGTGESRQGPVRPKDCSCLAEDSYYTTDHFELWVAQGPCLGSTQTSQDRFTTKETPQSRMAALKSTHSKQWDQRVQ